MSIKGNKVYSFGSGIYLGELVPDYEGERGTWADSLKKIGLENPTIKLDSGEIVYGCECWWGSEEKMKKMTEGKEIITVSVKDLKEDLKEGENPG